MVPGWPAQHIYMSGVYSPIYSSSKWQCRPDLHQSTVILLSIGRSPVVGALFCRSCLIVARIWLGVPRHWLFPSASGGHPPRLYPIRGLGLVPGAWGTPNKGNADGAVGIFWQCRARLDFWTCDRTHFKKALCHIRLVVGQMINLWFAPVY